MDTDPQGLLLWASIGEAFANRFPFFIKNKRPKDVDELIEVVKEIVEDFKHLVEHQGLNKELYRSDKKSPRHESTAQRIFHTVAYTRCKNNGVEFSPEVDTGTGKVDFKFSKGGNVRVLVEVKLSTNPKVVDGYTKQLEAYKKSQQTTRAIYLVIDVGKMGTKDKRLIVARNKASDDGQPLSDLEFVDGSLKPAVSKL